MRGVERAVKGAVLCAALLGASSAAFGAAGVIDTVVVPVSTNVTYSSPATQQSPALTTFIGYTATMTNDSPNTINSVVFLGTIFPADAQEQVTYHSAVDANCSVVASPAGSPANAITVQCLFGQFKAGDSRSFALFFVAPVKDNNSPTAPDNVTFSGFAVTAEGFNGGNSQNDSRDSWTAGNVALGTNNPELVKSAVPTSGGTFFTGTGVSLIGDPIATTVTVPPTSFTTATIAEGAGPQGTCNSFVQCPQATVTIPGAFSPYLSVLVRLDAANIKPGTKIESVSIVYIDSSNDSHDVGLCASPTTPRSDGLPCIAKRTYYKNKSVSGWTPELNGDYEFLLIQTLNGILQFF